MMWLSFIRDIAWKFIVAWGIISLLLIGWTTVAKSHSWYSPDCCSQKDCAPVIRILKEDVGESYVSQHGTVHVLPSDKVKRRPSKDDNFHICMRDPYEHEKERDSRTKIPICIYYPALH